MIALALTFAAAHVLTLEEALHTADARQPTLRQARAVVDAARARADQARAPILPQLTGSALYQRTTANFAPSPGTVPKTLTTEGGRNNTFDTFNFWRFSLTLTQLVWDFQSVDRWRAAGALAESQGENERAARQQVRLDVRTAYFEARARHSLVEVARETLANQERHLGQIEAFVAAGTRPAIDRFQARTDRANARVQLIRAENDYESAKAQLQKTMGVDGPPDYDVAEEAAPPVEGEERATEALLDEALRARPETEALAKQLRAQELTLRATRGGYGPSLSASTLINDVGTDIRDLGWNWNASLNLSWNLFSGLLTRSQEREASANLASLEAQRDGLRQQIRLEVDRARLAVRAAQAAASAADEALVNARERLRLAEGRYEAGVGNAIELGDAQVAFTAAAAQRVQAEYDLATARAQLLRALGRM